MALIAAGLGLVWVASASASSADAGPTPPRKPPAPPPPPKPEIWVAVKRAGRIVPGLAALYEDGPVEMKPDHYDADTKNWRWLFGTPEQTRAQMTMAYAGENVLVEPHEIQP
ncbi:MAG TPA: hypothetical protein VF420_13245 [Casimicrobiaceae bacterium]